MYIQMGAQIQISFPFHANVISELKENHRLVDMMKLEAKIKELENSNRTHKGHYTKLKSLITTKIKR